MEPFEISARTEHGTHYVTLVGELDIAEADRVADFLVNVAGSTVVVDLSGIRFLDAAGLSALLSARRRIAGDGNDLVMRGASPSVERVFRLCQLAHLLTE